MMLLLLLLLETMLSIFLHIIVNWNIWKKIFLESETMFTSVTGSRVFLNMARPNCVACSPLIHSCIGDLLLSVRSGW